jgi:hypothetical protein
MRVTRDGTEMVTPYFPQRHAAGRRWPRLEAVDVRRPSVIPAIHPGGRQMSRINSVYVLATGGVIGSLVVLGLVFTTLPAERHQELLLELGKASIGILPLVFFGVIVSDLLRQRDERRARQGKMDDFRRTFLNDVVVAYNRAKAIRRLIRAAGFGPKATGVVSKDQLATLDAQMTALSETQLDLERLKRASKAPGSMFTEVPKLTEALESFEQYVNLVVKDWEVGRRAISPGQDFAAFSSWTRFQSFLASKSEDGDFGTAAVQMTSIESSVWSDLLPGDK